MGVSIITQPEEVHWPNGSVSKAPEPGKKKRGGKKVEKKNKQGIFGQVVSDLAPKLPKQGNKSNGKGSNESSANSSTGACSASTKSRKNSAKSKRKKKPEEEANESEFQGQHKGLPVQGCKCKL